MEKNRRHLRVIPDPDQKEKFENLFVKHLSTLYSAALRLTGSKEEAQELVQETSLKGYRGFPDLEDRSRVKQWLLKILLNTYRNSLKKRRRKERITDVELTEELISSASVRAYDQEKIFGSLPDYEVEQALNRLPPTFRLVILLADVEGLSYQEIAETVDCPAGTVASRLFRARELMRDYLEEYARRRGFL